MKKYIILVILSLFLAACSHQAVQDPTQLLKDVDQKISGIEQEDVPTENLPEVPQLPEVPATETTVSIENFEFSPLRLEIKKGTKVKWTNKDSAPHTVTGDFADSGTMNTGDNFEWTFDNAGEFEYICTLHPSMKGIVVVTE